MLKGSEALLRLPRVRVKTGLSRTAIYNEMKQGRFPKSIRLHGTAVAWVESEVDEWIEERIRAARGVEAALP